LASKFAFSTAFEGTFAGLEQVGRNLINGERWNQGVEGAIISSIVFQGASEALSNGRQVLQAGRRLLKAGDNLADDVLGVLGFPRWTPATAGGVGVLPSSGNDIFVNQGNKPLATSIDETSSGNIPGGSNNIGGSLDEALANAKSFEVDPTFHAKDLEQNVLDTNGKYTVNPTAKKLLDLVTPSGKIGSKNMNGRYMYVIDNQGNIIIGTRGKKSNGDTLHMPHPTLIGDENPQVKAAGIIDIRRGKIFEVDNASGHFKPESESLQIAEQTFRSTLPPKVFHKKFNGFVPFSPD